MRVLSFLSLIVLSLAVAACTTTTAEDPAEVPVEDVAPVEDGAPVEDAAPANAVGEALSEELAPSGVADIVADFEAFADRKLRVQGVPASMCGSGCSVTMTDGDATLKVRAADDAFKFPPAWKGQEIMIEGTIAADPGCSKHHKAEGEGEAEAEAEGEHAHGEGGGFVLLATGAALMAPPPVEAPADAPVEEPVEAPAAPPAEAPAEPPAEAPAKH